MQVSEIMHQGIFSANINDSIKKVAGIMKEEDIGAVPVLEEGRPVGIVTDRDIVISCIAEGGSLDSPISKAMSENLISIGQDKDVKEAARLMETNNITRLLVLDENARPVGMLELMDIIQRGSEIINSESLEMSKLH